MEGEYKGLVESMVSANQMLAERWSRCPSDRIHGLKRGESIDFLKGIEDPYKRSYVARLLENAAKWVENMDEATRMYNVGAFEKFLFPLIRAVYANLVAADLVSVQPMDMPIGLVFYYDVKYGTTKGDISQGDKMFDASRGPSQKFHYTDEVVEGEVIGGTGGQALSITLAYTPIRPGTVKISDGTLNVYDDGNGSLEGNRTGAAHTINYATGAVVVTLSSTASADITATYEFDLEASDQIPQIDIHLTSSPVTARSRKLRARWSIEAQQDLKAFHGIDAETDTVGYMANEVSRELNQSIIRHLRSVAAAGTVTWDKTPPVSTHWYWWKEKLYDVLVQGSELVFAYTQRAQANWLICATDVAAVVRTLAKFVPGGDPGTSVAGVRKIGTIGQFTVFDDPAYPASEFLMGFKGASFLDTGYVHATYQGLYTTPTIVLDDFISRKGMSVRTAQKVVNAGFYCRGTVTQSGS